MEKKLGRINNLLMLYKIRLKMTNRFSFVFFFLSFWYNWHLKVKRSETQNKTWSIDRKLLRLRSLHFSFLSFFINFTSNISVESAMFLFSRLFLKAKKIITTILQSKILLYKIVVMIFKTPQHYVKDGCCVGYHRYMNPAIHTYFWPYFCSME